MEIRELQAAKLCEVPASTCKDKVNSEEQNIFQLSVLEFVGDLL